MTICIDVDEDIKNNPLKIVRLMYEYNIKKIIMKTKHGYHVYLNIPNPNDPEYLYYLYYRYGDDLRRAEKDLIRAKNGMRVNVCFKTSELYEVIEIEL
ncbi:MAG: hypothetical protein QXD16_04785 [Sulfolobales archaeon]